MAKNEMTIRSAGNTMPPPRAQAKIASFKGLQSKKVWKTLVTEFDRVPTPALLRLNKKKVEAHYQEDKLKYQAEVRIKEKSPKLKVFSPKPWFRYPNSLVRFYIVISMEIPGPPNTVVQPPATPRPPASPM